MSTDKKKNLNLRNIINLDRDQRLTFFTLAGMKVSKCG